MTAEQEVPPRPGSPLSEIWAYALRFDGYGWADANDIAWTDAVNEALDQWQATGRTPTDPDRLRALLFFEQRARRWAVAGGDAMEMDDDRAWPDALLGALHEGRGAGAADRSGVAFTVRVSTDGKLHRQTVKRLRRETGIRSDARTVRWWRHAVADVGGRLLVERHRDQDVRVVDVRAPRSELPATADQIDVWVKKGLLPVHELPEPTKAPRHYRERRWALWKDVVDLASGQPLEPPVRASSVERVVYVLDLLGSCSKPGHRDVSCVYVGETGRTPRERLIQHIVGHRASRDVRRLLAKGFLRDDLHDVTASYATPDESRAAEAAVAADLQRRGFGVHGGT